eukprot:gene28399-32077_t
MDLAYLLTPVITWTAVGPIKFLINSVKARRWAFNLVGNGGFPSNHSAVVSSMATLIALREGMGHPAFGVAVALCFIVIIDANSLRQHVGRQAAAINRLGFNITALLVASATQEPVNFDAVLQPSSLHYTISKARRAAQEAERYPKIAGRLLVGGEVCEDPHIERMIESFALLNSRVAKRLDDDYPEFTEAMFEVMYPHYLRPFPSFSIARMDYSGAPAQLTAAREIPRGT